MNRQIARGGIEIKKTALLRQMNLFTSLLDAYYRNTDFHAVRPHAPSLSDGQQAFTRPLKDTARLWNKINAGPAPAGVTLPLVLGDGTTQAAFAGALDALLAAYDTEQDAEQQTGLARAQRNRMQSRAYAIMKAYRETVPCILAAHPELVETLPRLTPLPGHTPAPVTASAEFAPPDQSKIVYAASADPALERYELRGNVGDAYSDEDAQVLATHGPDDPREFLTPFGLTQPGATVAFKVFVILDTGNEAGGKEMLVQRPLAVAG
jgi:hypothetical protein